ncbi:MAG: penicillin-binding protein 2 [Armatimonadota bacterium]|nr:penicillin-binding protein 2 [Armatimonadota bacterium]
MITSPKPPLGSPDSRRAPPSRQQTKRAASQRAWGFGFVIIALFLALAARLWYLQIAHGDDFREAAAANQHRRIPMRAPRGTILDRHGVLLAANRPRLAIYATPDVAKNAVVLSRLAALLQVTPDEIGQTITEAEQNPYDPVRIALDVPMPVVTQIEENKPFLPGVSTQPEPVRWYPRGSLAAHLIGTMGRINDAEWKAHKAQGDTYFSDDFLGKTGVEAAYEPYLRGKTGGTDVQIDAHGRTVSAQDTQDAAPGGTVHLTIDAPTQAAAERVLKEHNFIGAAVALDPRTGAVLAMASAPTFDPNQFATGITSKNWDPLAQNPSHPLINRGMSAMYPPGSTFKPVVAAAGWQTGAITPSSGVYCTGSYHLGRARFGCWETHGAVDFTKAIAESCDVFFYVYGQKIGPDRMSYYSKQFGLAEKTGIDLAGEKIGAIPSPSWKAKHFRKYGPAFDQWYGGDTLHMAIGQGDVLTTPLQMARVAATLANGGNVLKPYVVSEVTNGEANNILYHSRPTVVRHIPVSAANLERVRRAMRVTVTNGTGKVVNFPSVTVAAKTGSAQTHGSAKTHGLFICFAPYDHPTIAIAAIVEHGGHGGDTAGKVCRAMLQAYFHLKNTGEESARSD